MATKRVTRPGPTRAPRTEPLKASSLGVERRIPPTDCLPENCPCEEGTCTLSRYARSVGNNPGAEHTLEQTEQAVSERLQGLPINVPAMAALSNVYRAAGAVRNHLERTVLAPHELTWTGWVVLWVVWIWGEIETRHVATEAGISKGTLTGVVTTLEKRGLMERNVHPDDGRRMLVRLTPAGRRLMDRLFPLFNAEEAFVVHELDPDEVQALARILRKVVMHVERVDGVNLQPAPTTERVRAARGRR